ncbi:MAG: hypothetical protein RLZ12_852 [Bacillota bacterium]
MKGGKIIRDTVVFIDLENVYYGLKKYHIDPDHPSEAHNLFLRLQNYYGRESIRMMEAYADFEQLDLSMVSLQKKHVHVHQVYGNGVKGGKNAADIQLCLDAMEVLYGIPEMKKFVIVSADQDMIPLLDRLWSKGKRVELMCLCDESLSKAAQIHEFCDCIYNLFEFLNINEFKNLSHMDHIMHNAVIQVYEWYLDINNTGKSYGSTWIKNDFSRKLCISEIEAGHLFNKLLKGKYILPYEIELGGKIYYGYKVNLHHAQVQMIIKIAGYKVS